MSELFLINDKTELSSLDYHVLNNNCLYEQNGNTTPTRDSWHIFNNVKYIDRQSFVQFSTQSIPAR